ncbi:hypothetical protein SUGI_1195340 [Cryptomeria japonica]|nr:hypothetical protein SUGI_1195340 [Cryptomeria japonica]
MATEGFNPSTEVERRRNVLTEAGRSKKRAGQSSSGRLEGRAKQRRAQEMIAERRRRLRAMRAQEMGSKIVKKPWKQSQLYGFLYGEGEEEEFTEDELQMMGFGYERNVRFKDQNDPYIRNPLDWFKYGPYSPQASKGVVVGKPIRGRFYDNRVTMFTTVKDAEEQERIDQHDAVVDYDRKIESFDESVGVKYFWAFVRKTFRDEPLMPWNEWTLVAQIAVERRPDLDKYKLGRMLGKRSKNLITRCTAWFRPDLIYVKKPIYQVRFEPQEGFFRGLVGLLDPLTEEEHSFPIPGSKEEVLRDTYYGVLCRLLGVDQSVSDDDVVKAYEMMEEEQRSLCLDFLLSNQPVELLHPFTKGWRDRNQAIEEGRNSVSDSELGQNLSSDVVFLEDEDEENEESVHDSFTQQEMFWEKEFNKRLREFDEEEFVEMEDSEMNGDESEIRKEDLNSLGWENAMEPLYNKTPQSADGEDKDNDENLYPSSFLVKSAVRPFTYKNILREISLLRLALVEQRRHSHEPIRFF